MRFQWLQSVLDASLDAALFALLVVGCAAPPVLTALLLWKRGIWRPDVAEWRWRVWHVGLALGVLAAVAPPIFLLGLQFLPGTAKQTWFIDAGTRGMFYVFAATPVAAVLLGFGGGRQRWLGILSAFLSFGVLFLFLFAVSR